MFWTSVFAGGAISGVLFVVIVSSAMYLMRNVLGLRASRESLAEAIFNVIGAGFWGGVYGALASASTFAFTGNLALSLAVAVALPFVLLLFALACAGTLGALVFAIYRFVNFLLPETNQ